MIGFRGCGRYTDPFFEECFAMELEAGHGVAQRLGVVRLHPKNRRVAAGIRPLNWWDSCSEGRMSNRPSSIRWWSSKVFLIQVGGYSRSR